MEFYSRLNRPKTKPNNTGFKEEPILGYKYEENGKKVLVVKGMKDRYQLRQDALPGVEIKGLIARYRNGDLTALEKIKGMYGDFTEMPTSYVEAMNMVQNRTESFNMLPIEIKEKFNHNVNEFIRSMGSEEFKKIFTPEPINTAPIAEKEVNIE